MDTQLSKFYGYRMTMPVTSDLCRSSLVLLWYDFKRTDRTKSYTQQVGFAPLKRSDSELEQYSV
jgi:hypothetical protein